jgi:hypothetical protein
VTAAPRRTVQIPGYSYAAYVLDPAGYRIDAFCSADGMTMQPHE